MRCSLVGYQSVSVSRDEHGFQNKIERITLHGVEQKDQDAWKESKSRKY